MIFDEESIKNFDPDVLSASDKIYLQEKFFPKGKEAAWKNELRKQWGLAQHARRWEQYLRNESDQPLENPYRISHTELIRRAKILRPLVLGNAVTDFTKWIYSLYQGDPTSAVLNEGKEVEKQVYSFRVGSISRNNAWELVFQDPITERIAPKPITALAISKKPLYGIPDVVFREKATGRILIVERKASNRDVPDDGWPNLRAQLWTYGHIDEWKDAPEILLVGEVWARGQFGVRLNRVLKWNLRNENFHAQNQELYSIYASYFGN